jgi:hypothetical protein
VLEQSVLDDGEDYWKDFNLHKQQLLENLRNERRFGSTETLRNERSRIVDALNPLALNRAGVRFVDLCLGKIVV